MQTLTDAMKRYVDLTHQEAMLAIEKEALRHRIRDALAGQSATRHEANGVEAFVTARYHLRPREDALLATVTPQELLSFASFTGRKISERLVPRYGREVLLRCFDVTSSEVLVVRKTRTERGRRKGADAAPRTSSPAEAA